MIKIYLLEIEKATFISIENDGTSSSPSWTLISETYEDIDVYKYSDPTFSDIDDDGDFDLFVGEVYGDIYFYRNDGTSESPQWTLKSENYASTDLRNGVASPEFIDIDGDGDEDLFIGDSKGGLLHYENTRHLLPGESNGGCG